MPARSAHVEIHGPQVDLSAPSPKSTHPKRPARIKLGKVDTPKKPAQTEHADRSSPKKHAAGKSADKASVRITGGSAKKQFSLLDAVAQVLGQLSTKEAGVGLNAVELFERVQEAKLWSSPNGRTPHATLYAGMIREIAARGDDARFRRVGPGKFSRNNAASTQSLGKSRNKPTDKASPSKKATAKGGARS